MDPRLLWIKVDASAGPFSCWPWMGYRFPNGYGRAGQTANHSPIYAHRAALEFALGRPLAPDRFACHRCDNPPCCNPLHLYEGTAADNVRDRDRRRAA